MFKTLDMHLGGLNHKPEILWSVLVRGVIKGIGITLAISQDLLHIILGFLIWWNFAVSFNGTRAGIVCSNGKLQIALEAID